MKRIERPLKNTYAFTLALLKETHSMLELEAVVMIVGLRIETDLLHHDFCSLGLLLFLTFLLLIEKLLIVEYLTYQAARR